MITKQRKKSLELYTKARKSIHDARTHLSLAWSWGVRRRFERAADLLLAVRCFNEAEKWRDLAREARRAQ